LGRSSDFTAVASCSEQTHSPLVNNAIERNRTELTLVHLKDAAFAAVQIECVQPACKMTEELNLSRIWINDMSYRFARVLFRRLLLDQLLLTQRSADWISNLKTSGHASIILSKSWPSNRYKPNRINRRSNFFNRQRACSANGSSAFASTSSSRLIVYRERDPRRRGYSQMRLTRGDSKRQAKFRSVHAAFIETICNANYQCKTA
jgi:hypothetical protein